MLTAAHAQKLPMLLHVSERCWEFAALRALCRRFWNSVPTVSSLLGRTHHPLCHTGLLAAHRFCGLDDAELECHSSLFKCIPLPVEQLVTPLPPAPAPAVKTTSKRSFKWYWLGGYWADRSGRRTSDPGQSVFPQTAWQEYDVRTSALLSEEFNRWNVHPDAPVKDTRLLLDLAPQPY